MLCHIWDGRLRMWSACLMTTSSLTSWVRTASVMRMRWWCTTRSTSSSRSSAVNLTTRKVNFFAMLSYSPGALAPSVSGWFEQLDWCSAAATSENLYKPMSVCWLYLLVVISAAETRGRPNCKCLALGHTAEAQILSCTAYLFVGFSKTLIACFQSLVQAVSVLQPRSLRTSCLRPWMPLISTRRSRTSWTD